jgi:hypothetical protein
MRIRIVVLASVIVIVLAGMSLSVTAQGDLTPKTATPRPSPTNNGGSAKWTVKAMTFKSNYPKGFQFDLDVSSTGGKIVEAGVAWQHSPSLRRRAQGKIDASGKINATWTPGTADSVPQWVGVDYWWTLKDEAGNTFETPHQQDEYADNTRKWNHAESDDIIVYWQDGLPDEIGPLTLEAIEKNRPIYFQNWGKLLNYRPRAIIYSGPQPWAEWAPGAGTVAGGRTFVQGQTSASWGGTVQIYIPRSGPRGLAYGVVLHEVDHLYQSFNGGVVGDCWFIEGDATYFEIFQDYDYLAHVQDLAASGNLPTLQGGGPSCRGADARDAYDIGYAFFRYLAETFGEDAHRKIWELIGKGKTNIQALESVTEMTFPELEKDFRSWLGMENPEPPTAVPTNEFTFPPTPTYPSP